MSLFFVFFSFNSLAGDYKVDYAIDARGVAEAEGPAECTYGTYCRLEFKMAHISILLRVDIASKHRISVTVYGAGNGCCYFFDGERTKTLGYNNEFYVKVDIFEGRRRYGMEIVRNIKIGTAFLMFSNFPP